MDSIIDSLQEWFIEWFRDIVKNLTEELFSVMSDVTIYASDELEKSPETWNSGIFGLIREISINAIAPIAIIILTLVVCYDFISQFMNKSSREIELETVAKLCFKLCIGIFLLNHVFDFTMGIFAMGQEAVNMTTYIILGDAAQMPHDLYLTFESQINDLSLGGLVATLCMVGVMYIISLVAVIFVIVISSARMIEIYIYCSISPIPFATLTNREWGGSVGNNFIKNLFALSFQAFFMMLVIGIYNGLVNNMIVSSDDSLKFTLCKCMGYSVLLVVMLWRCGSISKSIFNAI